MNIATVIKRLRALCKPPSSMAKVAREIGVSKQYLSNVIHGHKAPGPSILKALGLKRNSRTTTTYHKG